MFGLVIICLPPLVMGELGLKNWIWAYVFLILLMMTVYQYEGILKFAKFVQKV